MRLHTSSRLVMLCLLATCGGCRHDAAPAGVRHPRACDLLSAADVSAVLGAPIGKAIPEDSETRTSCAYPPGEPGSYAQADVAIEWTAAHKTTTDEQMAETFGGTAVGRQVAHRVDLGDGGVYGRDGELTFRSGDATITVTVPMRANSEAQALAIGKAVLRGLTR